MGCQSPAVTLPVSGTIKMLLLLCFLATPLYGTHLLVLQDKSLHQSSSLLTSSSLRHRRDAEQDSMVEVRQFHVSSKLYSRFATVTMDSEVLNAAPDGSREIAFQVQVPETAFMSNFSMVVDGQRYLAQVLEKEAAEKRYKEAKQRNQTAGQVKQDPIQPERGMELFTINVNLAPRSMAFFTLIYNELLERRSGTYRQRLVIQPGTIVANMSVRASFAERQGFTYFAYKLPGKEAEMTSTSDADETHMTAGLKSRELVFQPTMEMQRNFDAKRGIHGEFTIFYRVNSEPEGGSIIVQNDYFAHFFAPPGLAPLRKNILFIIDISGSMSGDKIRQAKEAMLKILDDLRNRASDTFNILIFDDKVETWHASPTSTLGSEIDKAKGFVQERLNSRGGTDIYKALMEGLDLLLKGRQEKSCDKADIIVFLTDGDPTTGVTDIDRIINDVTNKNRGRAAIFSLGFGFNLNFDFLSKISNKNRGFARRIYAESDAQDQLKNFYNEISTPILCDVVASYSSKVVDSNLLTFTTFPLLFEGQEIIVAGKTKMAAHDLNTSAMGAELRGTGAHGVVDFVVQPGKIEALSEPDVEADLTEKLWAYMKIKSLLKDADTMESEQDQNAARALALNMSLTYGFVTPLTSFSIVVEDTEPAMNDQDSLMHGRPLSGRGNKMASSPGYYANGDVGHTPALTWWWGMVVLVLVSLLGQQ